MRKDAGRAVFTATLRFLFVFSKHTYRRKIMKRSMFAMGLLAMCLGIGTATAQNKTKEQRKIERAERKALQDSLDMQNFREAVTALDNKQFVLEADKVIFKYGQVAYVTSNTNFVALKGDKAVVQIAFNIPISGPNGLGGITVQGTASNIKAKTDKKGNRYFSMNVMGTGISAQVNITMPYGTNEADVDILPNFNSNHLTLSGRLLPMEKANVFKGTSL